MSWFQRMNSFYYISYILAYLVINGLLRLTHYCLIISRCNERLRGHGCKNSGHKIRKWLALQQECVTCFETVLSCSDISIQPVNLWLLLIIKS